MIPPGEIQAALIDLDGTLLDTALDLAEAANGMLADFDRPPASLDDVRAYVGKGVQNMVKRLLAGRLDAADDPAPPPQEAMASFRRHYHACNGQRSVPYPGVIDGLERFGRSGVMLACVTNKMEAFTLPLLEVTGLRRYFRLVVSGDSLPRHKPDPMQMIWACGALGVSPARTLAIGDSMHDAAAARAAGARVFLVPYGYNEGRGVQGLDCDAIVQSIDDAARRVCAL